MRTWYLLYVGPELITRTYDEDRASRWASDDGYFYVKIQGAGKSLRVTSSRED